MVSKKLCGELRAALWCPGQRLIARLSKITPSDRQAMLALDCSVEDALERFGMKLLS